MYTVVHCKTTLNRVKIPMCRNCHQVYILPLTNFLPFLLAPRITVRSMMRCADGLFCSFNPIGFQITKCPDLYSFNTCQSARGTCTPIAEANHRYANGFKCRGGISMHIKTITVEIGRASCRERV